MRRTACYLLSFVGGLFLLSCGEEPQTKGTRTGFFSSCPEWQPLSDNDEALLEPAEPNCSYDGALVCESFESGQSASWGIFDPHEDETLALQDCVAADGEWAAVRHSTGPSAGATIQIPTEPITNGPVHMRAKVFVPEEVEDSETTILFSLREEPAWTESLVVLRLEPDGVLWLSLEDFGDGDYSEPGAFERGKWVCIEASFPVGQPGDAQLRVDGEVVIDMSDVQTSAPAYHWATVFGPVNTPPEPFEMAIDDFVVATSPIGCD